LEQEPKTLQKRTLTDPLLSFFFTLKELVENTTNFFKGKEGNQCLSKFKEICKYHITRVHMLQNVHHPRITSWVWAPLQASGCPSLPL